MEKDKLKKFIKTTIREFLNENKYMDDVLDRMNSSRNDGKGIYQTDKEYLRRLKSSEDVSDIEQDYDVYNKMRDYISRERPIDTNNWEFVLIRDDNPLWYNKSSYKIEMYGDTRFFNESTEKEVYLNPKSIRDLEFDGWFIDGLIDEIYFSETRNELEENINKYIKKEKGNENKRTINGMRWVICDGDKYPSEMVIGKGYTEDKDFDYTSCPFWIFKVVFK